MAGDIAAVAGALCAVNRLAVELGQQDVRDGVQHGFWRAFEQVGDPDVEFRLPKADGVVDGDKRIEPNVHGRRRRTGTEFGEGFVENFRQARGHGEGRLA